MRFIEFGLLLEDEVPAEETTFAYSDTAEISAAAMPLLQAKVDKINKKAAKLGAPTVTLTKEEEFYKEVPSEPGEKSAVKELSYRVKIAGAAPKVEGYKFLATIEHTAGGNIIRTAPGYEENANIKKFYTARPDYCDHCHKIRQRIDTFIVADEKGNLRQIGRNCLSDFLGGLDPKAMLYYFSLRNLVQEAVKDAESEGEGSIRGHKRDRTVERDVLLRTAAAMIRVFGYRKRMDPVDDFSYRPSTGQALWWVFFGNHDPKTMDDEDKQWLELAKNGITAVDDKAVKNALDWFNALPPAEKDNNTFLHNLDVILKAPQVSTRNIGYAVAVFPCYYRALHAGEQKKEQAKKSNEWIGNDGDKFTNLKVTIIDTKLLNTNFGTTQLVRMEDEKGNAITWFNSGAKAGFDKGDQLTIKGTIKKQDEFKGRKQTLVTRVKKL